MSSNISGKNPEIDSQENETSQKPVPEEAKPEKQLNMDEADAATDRGNEEKQERRPRPEGQPGRPSERGERPADRRPRPEERPGQRGDRPVDRRPRPEGQRNPVSDGSRRDQPGRSASDTERLRERQDRRYSDPRDPERGVYRRDLSYEDEYYDEDDFEDEDQFRDEDRWQEALDKEEHRQKLRDRRRHKVRKKRGIGFSIFKVCIKLLIGFLVLFILGTLAVSGYMRLVESRRILTVSEWQDELREKGEDSIDCIFVLGCSVLSNKTPSLALQGRLDRVVELYRLSPHIIVVSGDHSEDGYYNEVKVMKNYLVEKGIPSEKIFIDHYGFSTYDSMYRAYNTFGIRKMTIVTQEYHLYRAIYLAKMMGMDVNGVAADDKNYNAPSFWDLREIFARDKDFLSAVFHPEATKTGDRISLEGNGDDTNER